MTTVETNTETFKNTEVRTTVETDHLSMGDFVTTTLEVRAVGQTNWVTLTQRSDWA